MIKETYVDGFVLIVPKKNKLAYKKMATEACEVWKKFGALDYKECVIEDPKPQLVSLTFAKLTKAKPSEEVWFSFITYKSRKHRDQVNKKVMAYFDKKYKDAKYDMPFDMKRVTFGGFSVEVGS